MPLINMKLALVSSFGHIYQHYHICPPASVAFIQVCVKYCTDTERALLDERSSLRYSSSLQKETDVFGFKFF